MQGFQGGIVCLLSGHGHGLAQSQIQVQMFAICLCYALSISESADTICFGDPSAIMASDGMFEVYRFAAEEGFLLETRKLVGTVSISSSDIFSLSYSLAFRLSVNFVFIVKAIW